MLTGKRAFKGTTAADTLSAILREDPTETIGTGSALPPGLLRVVRRCLEKSPEDRFQTARDLAFALEGATTGSRAATPETGSAGKASPPPDPRHGRHRAPGRGRAWDGWFATANPRRRRLPSSV